MWYGTRTEEKTDHERYLEMELDRYREEEERRSEEAYQERKRQREEIHYRAEERLRTADDWPEALRKQVVLCNREVGLDDAEDLDGFFSRMVAACERAQELWATVAAEKQPEIEELESRIAAIQEGIRIQVAETLEKESESDSDPWRHVAQSLRDEDPSDFLYW